SAWWMRHTRALPPSARATTSIRQSGSARSRRCSNSRATNASSPVLWAAAGHPAAELLSPEPRRPVAGAADEPVAFVLALVAGGAVLPGAKALVRSADGRGNVAAARDPGRRLS